MGYWCTLLFSTLCVIASTAVHAETVRWARAGDALTLDPHAQNEGPTVTLVKQIVEPLIMRDMTGKIVPVLATQWAPSQKDPNVWKFKLREGVKFHDGSDFDSEDVVFSFNRAMTKDSDYKELLAAVKEVRAVGKFGFEIVTNGPNPIMPNNLTDVFIMDKQWTEQHGVVKVQDYEGGEKTYAARNINGTGPYILVSREPDSKTVMKINPNYWGKDEFPMDVTEIIYTPIQNPTTRVAALLSGEVDFIQDVPVQDLARVDRAAGLKLQKAPQNRVIFFGMNQGDSDLKSDNIEGKNPLADKRVRTAMNIAINREAIKKIVMREQSIPAGVISPPFVNGWTKALDTVPATDIAAARVMMSDAGYKDGFSIRLDCPNNRYINDEAICLAAVGMLAQIGIQVNLDAKPKALHFPLITNLETDFYMLGWGVPTYDSEYIFNFLAHSRNDKYGSWNATRFGNPALDKQIELLASETDPGRRTRLIADIWKIVQEERLYIPIHHQVLNWGMADKIETVVAPDDRARFKYFKIKK